MKGSERDPDVVFNDILSRGGRSQKEKHLRAMHDICRKCYAEGVKDFSVASIGRLCEEAKLFKARILYNSSSSDYRELIKSWAVYSGPVKPDKQNPLEDEKYYFLRKIEDHAIRALVQKIISERDKLRMENNLLKNKIEITIDRRPFAGAGKWPDGKKTLELTQSEVNALTQAISPTFLSDQGWAEGTHGEVQNENGRIVFDVGFSTAIKKIIQYHSSNKRIFD